MPARMPLEPVGSPLVRYGAEPVVAFDERIKIHDLAIEGINAVLRRRGLPTVDALKAGKKR